MLLKVFRGIGKKCVEHTLSKKKRVGLQTIKFKIIENSMYTFSLKLGVLLSFFKFRVQYVSIVLIVTFVD